MRNNSPRAKRILFEHFQQFDNLDVNADLESSDSDHKANEAEINTSREDVVDKIHHNFDHEIDKFYFQEF